MGNYLLWLRTVEFSAVVAVLSVCATKMHKKGFALYFKIYLCAAASYALFLLYDIISTLCLKILLPVDIGGIGILGCGAFLLSANLGQMDGLVDERTKKSRTAGLTALIAPAVLGALLCVLVLSSKVSSAFKLLGIIPLSSGIIASYFHLKHILLPADSLGLLITVRPVNILALLFLLSITLLTGASVAGLFILKEIAGVLSAVFICAMSVCSVKEAKKWKTSI